MKDWTFSSSFQLFLDLNDHSNVVRSPMIELTGHSGVVIAADWLCTGNQVITASWDRTANLYDTERGEILHVLSGSRS